MVPQSFYDTVYLLSCAARGTQANFAHRLNFGEICDIARGQNVTGIIFPELKKHTDNADNVSEKICGEIQKQCVQLYSFQYKRSEFMKSLYAEFDRENLAFCLLKGESVARFYHEPFLRSTADVDIKIDYKDIGKCADILRKHGYDVLPFHKGYHHFECMHKVYGCMEVHVAFWLDETNDICFKDAVKFDDPYVRTEIPSVGIVNIMGYTDGFVYLIIHFIKHFISSGASIRHLMDIALYAENCCEHIDENRVFEALRGLGFEIFGDYIFYICAEYLHSDVCKKYVKNSEKISSDAVGVIFSDMLEGGIFGHSEKSRGSFYEQYLKLRAKEMGIVRKQYGETNILKKIFVPKSHLSGKFLYGRHSLLYPAAVIHRAAYFMNRKIMRKIKKEPDYDREISERMDTMRKLGLM